MRFFKSLFKLSLLAACVAAFGYFIIVPIGVTIFMPDDIRMTRTEIDNRQTVTPHQFVAGSYDRAPMTADQDRTFINLKLFGVLPIKRVMVDVLPVDKLYAGGVPVGFVAKTDGVVVLQDGRGYKRGDIITNLDSATITSVGDLERHLGGRKLGLWVKDDTSGVGTLTYINPLNNKELFMSKTVSKFALAAGVLLALAFTFMGG